jgi:hypothetical protein
MAAKNPTTQHSGCVDSLGYRVISVNGRRIREHRYVMEQFLERRLDPSELVHHKDEDKLNNSIENLALTNRRDHRFEHSVFRSETHKECTVCHDIKPLEAFYKRKAQTPNRSPYVGRCIDCQAAQKQARRDRKGRAKKLEPDHVRMIRFMHRVGIAQSVIASCFRVSRPCVSSIIQNRTWQHVQDW